MAEHGGLGTGRPSGSSLRAVYNHDFDASWTTGSRGMWKVVRRGVFRPSEFLALYRRARHKFLKTSHVYWHPLRFDRS